MKQAGKISVESFCWVVAGGLAGATLIGFFGQMFWLFDLFSHFRVQFFQLALVLIGIAIWKRNNRLLIASVVLACLNYAVVLPLYFGNPPAAAEKPARAMLMNVLASNGNTQEVLDAIQQADPDILLLEEVTPKWATEMADLKYPYRLKKVRADCFGMMLLSRYPLSHTNIVYVGNADVPTITATVHLPQGEIMVVGMHPVPPISAAYAKHRNAQLAALPKLVAEQTVPVLLIGDLNVSPWSVHFSTLLKNAGLKNSMKGFGVQSSWPADSRLLRIPIDHMLHTPEIIVHARATGGNVGSDHLPVIVDFTVQ